MYFEGKSLSCLKCKKWSNIINCTVCNKSLTFKDTNACHKSLLFETTCINENCGEKFYINDIHKTIYKAYTVKFNPIKKVLFPDAEII